MQASRRKPLPALQPIAAAVYYLITFLLLPVSIAGYVLWIAKALRAGRGSGVSGTAQGPLSARWLQHRLGVRPDETAFKLLNVLPGISPLALQLVFGPILLAHRLTGYVPKTFRYPFEGKIPVQSEAAARQTFFDAVTTQYTAQMEQLVILGAGFDTRALHLPPGSRVRAFEVDTPTTSRAKQELLTRAGIDASGVVFVAADFGKEDWLARLVDAGFDRTRPALFLWEGVIPYLEQAAVEDSLHKIAGSAPGSLVAFDYMTREPLESQALYFRYARAATRAAGEPLKFGIDSTPPARQRLAELLQSCGLSLIDQRTLGAETGRKRAWGGFAIAVVP